MPASTAVTATPITAGSNWIAAINIAMRTAQPRNRDPAGQEFARGLTNYATPDARRIRGLRTHQARQALGSALYDEVVHRDNLVLIL